jgi:hypothetical protein
LHWRSTRRVVTKPTSNANRQPDRDVSLRSCGSTPGVVEEGSRDMEVVLLWLDDVDDVLFSVALVWERLRRVVLQIGLAASLALAGSDLSQVALQWAPAFSGVAAGSVSAWLLGAGLRAFYYRETDDFLTTA